MGHKIFSYILFFVILFFKLRVLKHKISKLAIEEIYQRLDMFNKSHPLSRYKAKSGKNKEKCLMHFDPDARVFVFSN